jgi:hypothetical protein
VSNDDVPATGGAGEPQIFGVPSSRVVEALRSAGLADDAVTALLGRGLASVAAAAAGDAGFHFQTPIAETAPECALSYRRLFTHPDFIDGVTVVQASETPEELGFNARFHAIEAEFDGIARDLQTSSNCVAELRRELFGLARELEAKITEMDLRIDAKGKDKDSKDTKEGKDDKETKEGKEKDTKEGKDKEGKDIIKEHKDGKEHKDKDDDKFKFEKFAPIEKAPLAPAVTPGRERATGQPPAPSGADGVESSAGAAAGNGTAPDTGSDRAFVRLDDRPPVGETALADVVPEPTA